MERPFFLLLCVLSTFYFVNSQLYPVNHEVVYNYKGMVQSGTGEPITFVSDFAINAKVHVKGFENYTLVTIEDMTYGLYSGKNSEFSTEKMNFHDIPEPSKHIYKPFIIKYDIYGKTIGILTENDDKTWSVNIKRAIASLLQLNVHHLDSTSAKASGFQSEEHTVYGICNVLYDVVLAETSKYNITKHITTSECKEYTWKTNFNVQPDHCDVEFESPISTFAYIDYNVEKTDSGFLINNINAKNNIYLNTLNGHTDTQFVLVDQTLDYERQSEFVTNPKLETITNSHKRRLHFLSHSPDDKLSSDVTGGRPETVDMDVAMKDAMIGLHNVVDHMHQHQVELSISFEKQGKAVHFLLFKLRFLNEKYLRRFHKNLEGDTTEVGKDLIRAFLQALPLLGTYESHIFIRNLIWQAHVNEEQSIELLKELPFNIKYYSKKIWKEFSLLTYSTTNVTEPIRYTAMLAVSNLISRYNHMYPDDAVVTNYVDNFIDLFKKSKTEEEKVLMISVLSNIKTRKVLKFVEEVVQSESKDITPHIKTLATFGFKDEFIKNKDHLYKLYWPIFRNNDEDIELRSAAVIMLMTDASMETMLKMYWYMQSFTGHNAELYKIYYTTMESMSQSKTICNQLSSVRAKRIFKLLKKPTKWELSSFTNMMYDYYDSMFGFGAEVKTSVIGNIFKSNFMSFYVQLSPQIAKMNLKPMGFYLYLKSGNKLELKMDYSQNREASFWFDLIKHLTNEKNNIEVITLHHGQITSLRVRDYFSSFFTTDHIKNEVFNIAQMVTGEHVIPTLMGVPVTFNVHMPSISKAIFDLEFIYKSITCSTNFNINSTTWKQQIYGIEVYNPIEDSWHGCRRFHIFESNFPLDLKVMNDGENSEIEFNSDKKVKQFGVQTFVFSDVFLFSDHQNLESMKSFCGDCKPRYIVSQGEHSKKKHVLIKNNDDSNFVYEVSYFECEQDLTMNDISAIRKNIFQTHNKNWGGNSAMVIPLTLRHLWGYSSLLPGKGMCGFGITIKPNFKRIILTTNFSFRYNFNNLHTFNNASLGMSFTIEKNDGESDSCEVQIKTDSDDFDMEALITGEKNYKICMHGKKLWRQDEFDQEVAIYAGHNINDKCDYNGTFIGIVTKGMKSEKQTTNEQDVPFETCKSVKSNVNPHTCIVEHTNLRRFEYHIRYNKLPSFVQKYADDFSDMFRYYFTDYFERIRESQDTDDLKLIIEYPYDPKYESKSMDLYVQTKTENYKYKNVPYDSFAWLPFVQPYSIYYKYYKSAFGGMIQHETCLIEADHMTNVYGEYATIANSSSWVDLLHDIDENNILISIKKVDEKMVLHTSEYKNTLEVIVKDDGIEVSLNDQLVNGTGPHHGEWFNFKVSKSEHKIFLQITRFGIFIEFNGEYLKMLMENKHYSMTGRCFERLNTFEKV